MYKSGIKYKTDKVTHHGYERFYDLFMIPLKYNKMNILEIGIDQGRSLKTWIDYFPYANIYGIDINNEYNGIRYKIFKGDQSKKNDLKKIVKNIGTCKIIIDDGSHVPKHQLISFNYLFDKCLDFGGIYIIEDIETSYWKKSELYGYKIDEGYDSENNIVKIFKDIADIVNREFLLEENIEKIKLYNKISYDNLKYISLIMFGQNCIIIKKMTEKEYNKYGIRKYRFENKL